METFLVPEMWIKLALAILCGAAIGIERELHDKPAGLRTNMLICVGSTLITMVSLHVALTYAERQINIADPGRIAAQIVSGIGFLGAGTIIQARGSVHGLTTAATMWVLAGVGLAIGSGAYAPAIATTVILLGTLAVVGRIEDRFTRRRRFVYFHVAADSRPGLIDDINGLADRQRLSLDDFAMQRADGGVTIEFALTLATRKRDALIDGLLDLEGVRDVRVNK
ncbi:MAG: MgtC/SapB family protein [Gemmatimonadota bacterium]